MTGGRPRPVNQGWPGSDSARARNSGAMTGLRTTCTRTGSMPLMATVSAATPSDTATMASADG
jgi:hypothetical protein